MPATASLTARPAPDEFLAFYGKYVARVPDGDLTVTLETQLAQTVALLDAFGETGGGLRYAPGKWTVKEVVGHVADAERIFVYRALCAARGERGGLPGFDENTYVAGASFGERTLNSLMGELTAVRHATLSFFRTLRDDELARRVVANGAPVSARALAWIIAGHELHHVSILRERYVPLA